MSLGSLMAVASANSTSFPARWTTACLAVRVPPPWPRDPSPAVGTMNSSKVHVVPTRPILRGPLSARVGSFSTAELLGDVAGADQRDLVDPALVVGIDVGMLLSHEPSLTQTFGP